MGGIIHGDQKPLISCMPSEGNECVVRTVAVPCGSAFEQLPLSLADGGLTQHVEQSRVELFQLFVGRFVRRTDEVRRNSFEAALELALVKEAKAGRKECNHRGGLVLASRERRCRAWLVMVLQETGELILVIQPGTEML